MAEIQFGQIGPKYMGEFVLNHDGGYPAMSSVRYNNAIWYNGETPAAMGEIPGIASVWQLWLDGTNNAVIGTNKVLFSDDDGVIQELEIEDGVLSYDQTNGLHFATPVLPDGVGIKYMPEHSVSAYGVAFIGTDDNIYRAGYVSASVLSFSPGTVYSPNFTVLSPNAPKTGTWVKIEVTYNNLYALTTTGELWSIGYNNVGQTGHPITLDGVSQTYIRSLSKVDNIVNCIDFSVSGRAVAETTLYVIDKISDTENQVKTGGYNGYVMCGRPDPANLGLEVAVTPATNIDRCFNGTGSKYGGCLFNATDGKTYGVGYGGYGQFGLGTTLSLSVITELPAFEGRIRDAELTGTYSSYVRSVVNFEDDRLLTCGAGAHGGLGTGGTANISTPQQWDGSIFTSYAACDAYAGIVMGVTNVGKTMFSGYSGYYSRGDDSNVQVNTPYEQLDVTNVKKVQLNHMYNEHSVVLLGQDGFMYFRGSGKGGGRGDGISSTINHTMKIPISDVVDFTIYCGGTYNTAILCKHSDGTGSIFGYNGHGECGVGHTGGYVRPTKLKI